MSTSIKTKFGVATQRNDGYYRIRSNKTGNKDKYLHRLIFEDFYNINLDEEFPEGVHIHHVDGDPSNNKIWNLIPISKEAHSRLHNQNKKCSTDHKKRIGASRNSTGFFRVIKRNNSKYSQGFIWAYAYYKEGDNSQTFISSLNLSKLKEKVVYKGLEWDIVNKTKALDICKKYGYNFKEVC